MPRRIFYGWYIVIVSLFCRFMSTGVGFYIFNAFMDPLCKEKGWSRLDINVAPMIGNVVGVANMFIFGTLVMRVGPRLLMTLGPIVSGLAFACLGEVDRLWQFYLFFMLMILGNGAMAGIVSDTVVNSWFDRSRGKALGLSTVGVSLSGAVLPFAAMLIIEHMNLAYASIWIGAVITMMAPAAWAVVRDQPELYGMVPDGVTVLPGGGLLAGAIADESPDTADPAARRAGASRPAPRPWTFTAATRSASFWKLGLAYCFAMMSVVGVMFQLAPRFQDLGYSRHGAMYLMSLTALVGAAGKYYWGALCDRFEPRRVAMTLIATSAVGLGFGLARGSVAALALFIFIFGFSMGGVVSTGPILTAHVFGREIYASIARFVGVIINSSLLGYLVMGLSFDLTRSYDAAYALFIALDIIAVGLIFSIKRGAGGLIDAKPLTPLTSRRSSRP